MTQEEIIKTVNGFLVEEFEVDEAKITPDANLRDTLELDSLDYVDLVFNVLVKGDVNVKFGCFSFNKLSVSVLL